MYAMVVGPLWLCKDGRTKKVTVHFSKHKRNLVNCTTGSLKCEVELPAGKGAFAATMRPSYSVLARAAACWGAGGKNYGSGNGKRGTPQAQPREIVSIFTRDADSHRLPHGFGLHVLQHRESEDRR